MSRLIKTKCPECGARLKVDPDKNEAKCEYCGAISRVETGKPTDTPPPARGGAPIQPVIRISSWARWSWLIYVAVALVISLGTGGISLFTHLVSRTANGGSAGGISVLGELTGDRMQWVGNRQAMLVDVNQDGVADPVGWIRFLGASGSMDHLGAFDAVTGQRLWATDPISDTSNSSNAKAALAGDKLLVADTTGTLRAFSVSTGQLVWSGLLGERVERFCAGQQGYARVEKVDKQAVTVALATGQLSPAGAVDEKQFCSGLFTDVPGETPAVRFGGGTFDEWIMQPEMEGLDVGAVVADLRANTWIALGTRKPGTRVPTAAGYKGPGKLAHGNWMRKKKATPTWLAAIPGVNPLGVEQGAPGTGTISQGRLLVPYQLTGAQATWRLACLEATSGRSLWDVAIPQSETGGIGAVVASDRMVFVSGWTFLHLFDLGTGQHRATIGRWM